MKIRFLSFLTLLSISVISCSKSNGDVQTHTPSSTINYQVKVSNPSVLINGRIAGGTINWTAGDANASELRFRAESDTTKIDIRSKTPQKIDLFNPLTTLGKISLKEGTYKVVRFDIELEQGTNSAFELKGTYNSTPVIFRVTTAFEMETKSKGVTLSSNSSYAALTSINLTLLTQNVTGASLDAATKDANGAILISSTSNSNIYNTMFAGLHDAGEHEFH